MKKILLILISILTHNIYSQRKGGMYLPINLMYGPHINFGLSTGSRADYKPDMFNRNPGGSAMFGFQYYKFVTAHQNVSVGLNFLQQRWNFSLHSNSLVTGSEIRYAVSESSLILPLEFNHYFPSNIQHWFMGFSADPGFVIQKNLERRRRNDVDSAMAYEYSERIDFAKLNLGGSAKFGCDFDFPNDHILRFYLMFSARTFFNNDTKRSSTYGFFLGSQYFWTQ